MTQIGSVYGQALYTLARDEQLAEQIRQELLGVGEVLTKEPEYLRLLSAANVPRQERCGLVDSAFRDKVHPYILNFLKIHLFCFLRLILHLLCLPLVLHL